MNPVLAPFVLRCKFHNEKNTLCFVLFCSHDVCLLERDFFVRARRVKHLVLVRTNTRHKHVVFGRRTFVRARRYRVHFPLPVASRSRSENTDHPSVSHAQPHGYMDSIFA